MSGDEIGYPVVTCQVTGCKQKAVRMYSIGKVRFCRCAAHPPMAFPLVCDACNEMTDEIYHADGWICRDCAKESSDGR